ncbi:MAG: class I SAM-dependent methyltransferase [Candidatus Zixiibacteriota bacterium]|nr:MAG: class I SAM-dependent methyltransferase [candidate division Zixibacteria bacterium]
MLTPAEIKRFYDAFGQKQDRQFYEAKPVDALIAQGAFHTAQYVIELGCGTGKLAARLLRDVLPPSCRYLGLDISDTMIALCRDNLAPFGDRAECRQTDGTAAIAVPDNTADRFIAAYVLDLLSPDDIEAVLAEARRVLRADGTLCLAGLTHGTSISSRLVERIWNGLFALSPKIVGGCRPIKLRAFVAADCWQVAYDETIVSYGVPSEVLVARRL